MRKNRKQTDTYKLSFSFSIGGIKNFDFEHICTRDDFCNRLAENFINFLIKKDECELPDTVSSNINRINISNIKIIKQNKDAFLYHNEDIQVNIIDENNINQ